MYIYHCDYGFWGKQKYNNLLHTIKSDKILDLISVREILVRKHCLNTNWYRKQQAIVNLKVYEQLKNNYGKEK